MDSEFLGADMARKATNVHGEVADGVCTSRTTTKAIQMRINGAYPFRKFTLCSAPYWGPDLNLKSL